MAETYAPPALLLMTLLSPSLLSLRDYHAYYLGPGLYIRLPPFFIRIPLHCFYSHLTLLIAVVSSWIPTTHPHRTNPPTFVTIFLIIPCRMEQYVSSSQALAGH